MDRFQGFTDQTVPFLWELAFNNNRTWFNDHKQVYLDHLYRPMTALGHAAYDLLTERCPDIRGNLKITRIYRDARRLHGGGPYKDHLWLSVERPHDSGEGDWHGIPALWFEVSPRGWEYGFGYWGRPADMEQYRSRIRKDPKPLEKLVRRFNRQDVFTLEGEEYRRSRGETTRLLTPWFNRKNVALVCRREPDELFRSPALVETLVEGWQSLEGFYRFFDGLWTETGNQE